MKSFSEPTKWFKDCIICVISCACAHQRQVKTNRRIKFKMLELNFNCNFRATEFNSEICIFLNSDINHNRISSFIRKVDEMPYESFRYYNNPLDKITRYYYFCCMKNI